MSSDTDVKIGRTGDEMKEASKRTGDHFIQKVLRAVQRAFEAVDLWFLYTVAGIVFGLLDNRANQKPPKKGFRVVIPTRSADSGSVAGPNYGELLDLVRPTDSDSESQTELSKEVRQELAIVFAPVDY
jgi:hypothetical protein